MNTHNNLNQHENKIFNTIKSEHFQESNRIFFLNHVFNSFAKKVSDIIGSAWAFIMALILVITWALVGHFFYYSDTWQLVINTGTSIATFLIVCLIQNTQRRDTEIINLKLDELIRAQKSASNSMINLETLSDGELKSLKKEYVKICEDCIKI